MAAEHDAIAATRTVLATIAEGLWDTALEASGSDAAYLARVAVLAEQAEEALFDVLNAAASYLDDADAQAVLPLRAEART